MGLLLFANNAQSTLSGPIASTATSLNVAAGTGNEFPLPGVGQYFVMTLNDQATKLQREIIWVTARSGDTMTVVRGQEGTSAQAWLANDIAANWWTAGQAAAMVQVAQLQQQATNYAIDTGSVNNVVITLTPPPSSLSFLTGTAIRVLIEHTNTGAATLAVNGLSATVILGVNRQPLLPGALVSGHIQTFIFDGTNFIAEDVNAVGGVLSGSMPIPGLASGAAVANIGFTPVQQGGGAGQGGDKIYLGYSAPRPRIQVNTADLGQIAMVSDFIQQIGGTGSDFIWTKSVDGTIIQAYEGINSTGADFITFPNAFPNKCVQVLCHEAAPQGWINGTTPTIFGTQQITATSFALYVTRWNTTSLTWAYAGGIAYRYIAIGY